MSTIGALDGILLCAGLWLAIGAAGLAFPRRLSLMRGLLFPLGAITGLALAACALTALLGSPEARILPIGLPDLPFHVRVDALSAFFLLLLGAAGAGISIYAAGYLRPGEGTAPGLHCLLYHLFLASMVGVLVADDGYAFMVAWETMALSSYFLVVSEHRHAEIRRAGYLYLLIAHVGAVAILSPSACWPGRRAITPSPRCAPSTRPAPGRASPSCSPSSASAPRPASCRCTSGCPRHTRPRPRRSRR